MVSGRGKYDRERAARVRGAKARDRWAKVDPLVSALKPSEIIYGEGMPAEDLHAVAALLHAVHETFEGSARTKEAASMVRKALLAVDTARGVASRPEIKVDLPMTCRSCGEQKTGADFRLGPVNRHGERVRNTVCNGCITKARVYTVQRHKAPAGNETMVAEEAHRKRELTREHKRQHYHRNREAILAKRRAARLAKKESGE